MMPKPCKPGFQIFVAGILTFAVVHPMFSQEKPFRLAPLFGDNAVLQQKSEAPFWGKGKPGARVSVSCSWGIAASTRANADGSWLVRVSTPGAGGPYSVTIGEDDTVCLLRNVLIGEVWLCSGQSNMEMPLEGWPPSDTISNWKSEIRNSDHPDIRLFAVRRAFAPSPEFACEGSWTKCSPVSSPTFSATAYFFGKMLYDSLKVPVGLIQSSWGGTPIESWTSAEYLSRLPRFDTTIRRLEESLVGLRRLQDWLNRFPQTDMRGTQGADRWRNLSFRDEQCSAVRYNDSAWRVMQLPVVWERTGLGDFDGVVWFRRTVEIPPSWLHQRLVLELGPIDDMDITFVNGAEVGRQEGEGFWKTDRIYRVPGELVDTTVLQIAVRVMDTQGGGGIWGKPETMGIHVEGGDERMPLAGSWKYLPVAELRAGKFYAMGAAGESYWSRPLLSIEVSAYVPTTLYNAMIAPLVPGALRGAIWYQGESNVDNPALYRDLFTLMIKNWRSAFQNPDMPFYYVQIAPFEYDPPAQSQYLREAQLLTLLLENTGMVVTMDIGNPKNIHPSNKQDVGRRLALWALARTYQRPVSYSGPVYSSMKIEKSRMILSFTHTGKGLVLKKKGGRNGFQVAGEDRIFKDATVVVRGDKLIVSSKDVRKPIAVQYGFSNAPEATLFNAGGLPASSFRTDAWER